MHGIFRTLAIVGAIKTAATYTVLWVNGARCALQPGEPFVILSIMRAHYDLTIFVFCHLGVGFIRDYDGEWRTSYDE